MKKTALILLLITALCPPVLAQDDGEDEEPLLVAFVNLQLVQEEWIEVQEFMLEMQTRIQEKEAEVQPKLDEYSAQIMTIDEKLNQPISDEKRAELESERQRLVEEAMRERDNAISVLDAQEKQGLEKLYGRIYEVIEQIGKDGEFDIILDHSAILYIKEAYDLTDKVIETLNETAGT